MRRIVFIFALLLLGCTRIEMVKEMPPSSIYVSISGCVENSNEFELEKGSTLEDLLKLAKPLENADLSNLSATMPLYDGDEIVVLEKGCTCISINTASKEELMRVTGIGEKTAITILEYREKYGLFHSLEELMNIKGIGEKKLAKMKSEICL